MSEFYSNKYASFLLEKILDVECLFIKLGISFPLGSSLLLVAKKY